MHNRHPQPRPLRTAPLLPLVVGLALFCSTPSRFCASLLAATPSAPPPESIGRSLQTVQTILTHFIQERHLSLLEQPLRTEGWLCSQAPGRVRWETTAPYQSILVADATGVAQLENTNGQWKALNLGLEDALRLVIQQISGIVEGRFASGSRDYEASTQAGSTGPILVLIPKAQQPRKMIERIEVHLSSELDTVQRVILHEHNGDHTDIRFSEQVINRPFPDGTFNRTQPLPIDQVRRAVALTVP